jgi:hypothetical protein
MVSHSKSIITGIIIDDGIFILMKVSQSQSSFIIIHDIIINIIMLSQGCSCNMVISGHDGITIVIMRLKS